MGCASQFCAAGTIFAGVESWFSVFNYVPHGMSFLYFYCSGDLGSGIDGYLLTSGEYGELYLGSLVLMSGHHWDSLLFQSLLDVEYIQF